MKKKENSLIYLTFIIIYTVLGCTFLNYMYMVTKNNFTPFSFIIYIIIISIPFGLFLGLENFISELKKEGEIKWNIYKVILSFMLLLLIINYLLGYSKITPYVFLMKNSTYSIMLCSILFGYMITSLFEKNIKSKD